jgi:hypothetical protein
MSGLGGRRHGKSFFDVGAALVGCGYVSGLLMRQDMYRIEQKLDEMLRERTTDVGRTIVAGIMENAGNPRK